MTEQLPVCPSSLSAGHLEGMGRALGGLNPEQKPGGGSLVRVGDCCFALNCTSQTHLCHKEPVLRGSHCAVASLCLGPTLGTGHKPTTVLLFLIDLLLRSLQGPAMTGPSQEQPGHDPSRMWLLCVFKT